MFVFVLSLVVMLGTWAIALFLNLSHERAKSIFSIVSICTSVIWLISAIVLFVQTTS